jgi:hypothetical protein
MTTNKSFFVRAFDALIAGREAQAKRYVTEFEREYAKRNGPLTKR